MHDNNPHLRNVLRNVSEQTQVDDETGLPSLDESAYQPHARPSYKPLYAIHFVNPKGEVRSCQYIHLDSNSSYSAGCINLTFMGMEAIRVQIHGRNLWRLYDYIHQHRIAWVMTAARDFASDGQTVVTRVSFAKLAVEADEGCRELEET